MTVSIEKNGIIFNPPQLGCGLFHPGLPGSGNKSFDRSPFGNTGTIMGAVWQKTPGGLPCLYFDGVDDKAVIPGADSLKPLYDSWTVKVWFMTGLNQRQMMLICEDGTGGYYLDIWNDKQLEFKMRVGPFFDLIQGSTTGLHDGNWHHAVAVRNEQDGKLYLYLDGKPDALPVPAANTTGREIAPSGNLTLAVYGASYRLQGCMAMLEIHRGAWNALDAHNNFIREKHLFGVL